MTPNDIEILNSFAPFEIMKIILTFDGDLPSSGNSSSKPKDKWLIRQQFHPQLEELWKVHPALRFLANNSLISSSGDPRFRAEKPESDDTPRNWDSLHQNLPEGMKLDESGLVDTCAPLDYLGRKYVPLIRKSLHLCCTLNILFLRKEEPGSLTTQSGDIDNRIKTLLDGLRMPVHREEIVAEPEPKPEPMFCLLENDSLINEMTVRTGRLLSGSQASRFYCRLIIEVSTIITHVKPFNAGLLEQFPS